MEFNVGDIVALYGDFTSPRIITDKGCFFSETAPNNEEILYKISKCGEAWYSKECLENYDNYNFDVKAVQEECHLCKRYGKPNTVSGYCMGFPEYAEPSTIVRGIYCGVCGVFIENS